MLKLRRNAQGPRAGFTIIEVMISMLILTVALGAVSSMVVTSTRLNLVNRERAIVVSTVDNLLEEIQATDFELIFRQYNADPADDVDGPGTAPGSNFTVGLFQPQLGDADGFVGAVEFGTVGPTLREDPDDDDLGLPRDLNFDGVIDNGDRAADYALLPIRLRVQWSGRQGNMQYVLSTTLGAL